MKKIIINSTILASLLITPTLFFTNQVKEEVEVIKQERWVADNTDFDHPEKAYKEYYNVDRDVLPWDMFGDWSIPERSVDVGKLNELWNAEGSYWQLESPIRPSFGVLTSYWQEDKSSYYKQEKTNWHETYSNFFNYIPDEEGVYWDGSEWTVLHYPDDLSIDEDLKITSRTPMRGIIPFWENTSAFNTYVLNETSNGTLDSSNLTYEASYASYINDYVNSTESTYPNIYKYLDNPDLLYDLFITNDDSVEWILPEGYKLVEYEDLTNAFVGFDSNWDLTTFMEYMFDFVIWNWNENIYPSKSGMAYYGNLKEIGAEDISIDLLSTKSEYGRMTLKGDGYGTPDSPDYESVTIGEFDTMGFWVGNRGSAGDYTSDDVSQWNQIIGIAFDEQTSSDETDSPKYRWGATSHWYSPYDGRDDYFEMYNPFTQQMNVNITPTIISFEGASDRFTTEFVTDSDHNHKYFLETTLLEFKTEFEEWLLNSSEGLNKYFVDFYSDCHVNDYYNNMSGDGMAFLGHNRFQDGIYPVEDLRSGDIIITYSDQDGNEVTDEMMLGDVNKLNITIEFNEASETAKLFDASAATPETISFDTSSLESRDPITPDNGDDEKGFPVILVLVIAGVVIAGAAVLVVVLVKKNK